MASHEKINRELNGNIRYRGTFQKIHSQEETGLPNVLALLGKLIGLVYHNIVAKLWRGVAVAV